MSFLKNLALKQCDPYLFIPEGIRVDNLKVAKRKSEARLQTIVFLF
jgi:hypothetical protein